MVTSETDELSCAIASSDRVVLPNETPRYCTDTMILALCVIPFAVALTTTL